MLTLLPGEEVLAYSDNNEVTLTTHRICYEQRRRTQLIPLEHINRCQAINYNPYWMLLIAAALELFNLQQHDGGSDALSILAIAFATSFFATRNRLLIIKLPSTIIKIKTNKMPPGQVQAFVSQIEQAKKQRLQRLL